MRLIRFRSLAHGGPQLGVLEEGRTDAPGSRGITGGIGPVMALAGGPGLSDLLALPLSDIREACEKPSGERFSPEEIELLAPVDGRTEVWAAGVTYERSRAARVLDSEESADVYARVYAAERPELFFKSAAWRVRGPGRAVSVRADSAVDVPEPELAAVLNYAGEVVGYTICNDMSSRSIEGQNPLYLPQAKIYFGGCAVGPWIRPAWEVPDPYSLAMELTIQPARRRGLAGSVEHVRPAPPHRGAHRVPVPRGGVPCGRDLVHGDQPGPGSPVQPAGWR